MPAKKKTIKKAKNASPKQIKKTHSYSHDENVIGMLAHLLGLFFGFIGPLVIFLVKNDEKSGVARENARHALNFQISMIIYIVISFVLMIVVIGFFMLFALGIFALVTQILGAIRAYDGKVYEYPLEIPFIK